MATKDDAGPFDVRIQEEIAAHIVTDEEHLKAAAELVRPEHFDNPILQDIVRIVLDYFKRFEQLPSEEHIQIKLEALKDQTMAEMRRDMLRALYEMAGCEGFPLKFSGDKLREYCEDKAFRNGLIKSAAILRDKGNLNAAKETMRAVLATAEAGTKEDFDFHEIALTADQRRAQDIKTEWIVEKLIPARAITLLHASGGLGKTWLLLAIEKAISEGLPFLGLPTTQRPVYYFDLENPLPVFRERLMRLDIHSVITWHLSDAPRPPKLDKPEWTFYKKIPPGSFVVFDTLRSFYDGEENSSEIAAFVMNRLKEIREQDVTIVLLGHSPKLNPNISKGSTAWEDLADHVLAFHKTGRGNGDDDDDEGMFSRDTTFFLGTSKKTRYNPFQIYITRDPVSAGFIVANSPAENAINELANYIAGPGFGKNQTEIRAWVKDNLGPGRTKNLIALLRRGEKEGRWCSHTGPKGSKIYESIIRG